MNNILVLEGAMGQLGIATQRETTARGLPAVAAPAGQISETPSSGFAQTCNSEKLVWTELTRRDRTFEFSRELNIRVLKEDGGWAFESDDPELMGFGLTRSEAEQSFCVDFAACWDEIACQDDEILTQDAIEMKRSLLGLVKALK